MKNCKPVRLDRHLVVAQTVNIIENGSRGGYGSLTRRIVLERQRGDGREKTDLVETNHLVCPVVESTRYFGLVCEFRGSRGHFLAFGLDHTLYSPARQNFALDRYTQ